MAPRGILVVECCKAHGDKLYVRSQALMRATLTLRVSSCQPGHKQHRDFFYLTTTNVKGGDKPPTRYLRTYGRDFATPDRFTRAVKKIHAIV